LNLEALALTKSEETGPVVDLAHKVVSSNRKSLDRLRDHWDKAMVNIKAGQLEYIKRYKTEPHAMGLLSGRNLDNVREL
jgi:hypothetical protein